MRGGPVDKGRCSTITTGLVSSEHNKGIEGLAWDPARALFYVAVEKYPMRVVSIGLDGRTTELFDAEALLGGGPCSDVAGLAYDGESDLEEDSESSNAGGGEACDSSLLLWMFLR